MATIHGQPRIYGNFGLAKRMDAEALALDDTLDTSVAQVFNERGDGVIVRGGPARISSEDRQPHLTAEDASELLLAASTHTAESRVCGIAQKPARDLEQQSRGIIWSQRVEANHLASTSAVSRLRLVTMARLSSSRWQHRQDLIAIYGVIEYQHQLLAGQATAPKVGSRLQAPRELLGAHADRLQEVSQNLGRVGGIPAAALRIRQQTYA